MKISFKNDYSEGCHPNILKTLVASNLIQEGSYGHDNFSLKAAAILREKCKASEAAIHFVSGGTQANLIIATAMLRPHESIIAAESGHIFTNEAGAIEACGHKIHSVPSSDGKLTPTGIQAVLKQHERAPHQLKPRLVYISNATELGTHYTLFELRALHECCNQYGLLLFMDGARLGQALQAEGNDLELTDVASLTDAFYLGGTKNGALIGEAIVITTPALQTDFEFIVKQKGALLSKSRLIGIQFYELLKDNLYFELAAYANSQAMRLKKTFLASHCSFLADTYTNMIFPILNEQQIEILSQQFEFYRWKKINENETAIRIITSWASSEAQINAFIEAIKKI